MRYAVSQAVGRQAASSKESSLGFGSTFQAGTETCSANVPWYRSVRMERGSLGPTPCPVCPITECSTTSLPSSSTPAASHPRIIGNRSSGRPTPRSDHRSWWFREAALTFTVAQPSRATGAGRSPNSSPFKG